jgi:hypothetical protein
LSRAPVTKPAASDARAPSGYVAALDLPEPADVHPVESRHRVQDAGVVDEDTRRTEPLRRLVDSDTTPCSRATSHRIETARAPTFRHASMVAVAASTFET